MQFNSLKQNHLFAKAYKKGKKSVMKSVCVYCMRNFKDTGTFMGITVSTKLGGAVERNRAKRVIRAAYRQVICGGDPSFAFTKDQIIVIVARSGCYDGTFGSKEVERDLRGAFLKLGLTRKGEGEK